MGTGSSVTQVNTTLDTGSLSLHSGQDTTLAGAQVRADTINELIDGNLNITSRQDTETQKNKQGSAGFGGNICIPPFCYDAPVTVFASLAAGKMNSDYKSVTDQSGLFAGKGSYDITVGKNTTLQGAVIASEASAAITKKMVLGSFSWPDSSKYSRYTGEPRRNQKKTALIGGLYVFGKPGGSIVQRTMNDSTPDSRKYCQNGNARCNRSFGSTWHFYLHAPHHFYCYQRQCAPCLYSIPEYLS